jgi:hypothetical protein
MERLAIVERAKSRKPSLIKQGQPRGWHSEPRKAAERGWKKNSCFPADHISLTWLSVAVPRSGTLLRSIGYGFRYT